MMVVLNRNRQGVGRRVDFVEEGTELGGGEKRGGGVGSVDEGEGGEELLETAGAEAVDERVGEGGRGGQVERVGGGRVVGGVGGRGRGRGSAAGHGDGCDGCDGCDECESERVCVYVLGRRRRG
jgi:hypothetical protein